MTMENSMRSFANAIEMCRGTPFKCDGDIHPDGIKIYMRLEQLIQTRLITWHELEQCVYADWGALVIDDMKEQLIARARII